MDSIGMDTIWVLIAAALVMLMQAGFSLVEIGLTRAKNSINILMKNFVDFSTGSIIFWVFGFSLMFGEDIGGFIGMGDFASDSNAIDGIPFKASLIFQTVFAATAATIVSGAIAERTKFSAYLIFSIIVTAIIYYYSQDFFASPFSPPFSSAFSSAFSSPFSSASPSL